MVWILLTNVPISLVNNNSSPQAYYIYCKVQGYLCSRTPPRNSPPSLLGITQPFQRLPQIAHQGSLFRHKECLFMSENPGIAIHSSAVFPSTNSSHRKQLGILIIEVEPLIPKVQLSVSMKTIKQLEVAQKNE